MKIELNRVDNDFHFQGIGASQVKVNIDGSPDIGGHNEGARPMELLLMSLGSCSGIDIILILKKQKQHLKDMKILINGERDYTQTPAVFKLINIQFKLFGNLEENKVERAVNLSMEKYCSVAAMLNNKTKIDYSFSINH